MTINSFFLYPKSPFHFDGTFHKPSHFPNKLPLDDWQPGKYWQLMRVGEKLFGLRIEDRGDVYNPKLKVTAYFNFGNLRDDRLKDGKTKLPQSELELIKKEIIYRYELDQDLSDFIKLTKKNKRFTPVFNRWLGMRNSCEHNLYELLIISIVLQNATVHRSVQMLDNLLVKYGDQTEFDHKKFYAIWRPENLKYVSEQELRDLKIGYRAKFIKRLTEDFIEKKVDEFSLRKMTKESARNELMKLYGVGPETSRILLFEALHHYDAFDHIAPWQQKIYSQLFYNQPLVSANKIKKDIIKHYGRYSMLAVHYIWEDIFWRRKNEKIDWLEKEIRL